MKISILASGSKGNCTYIETPEKRILVDVGISCLSIERNLRNIEIEPKTIDSVLITHTHSDHINGLKNFCKKYKPKVYVSEKIYKDLYKEISEANFTIVDHEILIADLLISFIKTSHDSSDSNGFIFEHNNKTIAYITDTGYINTKYHDKLKNKNLYVMESNHDIEMLMNGDRPYHLKQRILGDEGHLSNVDSAYYLSQFIGNNTNCIILAHLSEDNNTAELAHVELTNALRRANKKVNNIVVAKQNERTELIEI